MFGDVAGPYNTKAMKFGKRFLIYQGQKDPKAFIDYKALKQAIKGDCEALDHLGTAFENVRSCEFPHYSRATRVLGAGLRAGPLGPF